MILQALNQRYETLVEKGQLSRPGWDDAFKVSYGLVLGEDGTLRRVLTLLSEEDRGKKKVLVPQPMQVPAHEGRTVAITANFLCDNSSYLLGVDQKGKPARTLACFQACAELHRQVLDGVDSPVARAILRFFDSWDPAAARTHPALAPCFDDVTGNANLLFFFTFDEGDRAVTQDPAIRAAWQHYYDAGDPDIPRGRCLITGQLEPIARTHPPIKGVRGAQSSGAALVSFNAPAFCSYGHEQNLNAPVGTTAAFAYTTALNRLLADQEHCRMVGDVTVVCWAEHGDEAYQDAMFSFLDDPGQSAMSDQELAAILDRLAEGKPITWDESSLDPNETIYFLGLAPNAARLAVCFFLRNSLGDFAKNIRQHYEDIAIVRPSFDEKENLSLWRLVSETINMQSRDKKPSPRLPGDLLWAILNGTPYPATLLQGAQLRIRAEKKVTRGRAAIIKGCYRRANATQHKEVFNVQLNEESTYLPYVLGRLFSVLEALQQAANPGINTTIRDRYFNSASATPALVFPTLINLAQKHLGKLDKGLQIHYDKQITELQNKITEALPARLTLEEQGAFQIGYYHQTQKNYTKKEENHNV